MFSFFDSILDWIKMIADFVVSAFKMLIDLLSILPRAIGWLVTLGDFLPPFVGAFLFVPVAFAVLLFILNR